MPKTVQSIRSSLVMLTCAFVVIAGGVTFVIQQYQRDSDAASISQQFDDFRTCINKYSRLVQESTSARSTASAELQAAQQRVTNANTALWSLITKSFTSGVPVTKKEGIRALGRYQAASAHQQNVLHQLQAARAAHPPPELPAQACAQENP